MRSRSFWGWGYEGEGLGADEIDAVAALIGQRLGGVELRRRQPPDPAALRLPPPRIQPPDSLAPIFSDDPVDRAGHAYGKAFRDVARHLQNEYPHPPDLVARPAVEAEVEQVLAWCADQRVAAIPYGGGSSVVGGVEPDLPDGYAGSISLDLERLAGVIEVDEPSRAARVLAGTLGPALEDALRPRGLTLRHYPQSFELSSVGGWIATRSGGHHATLRTRIDEFVEAVRMITPAGLFATRRLPGSGAGPDPNRLILGSEGSLGVITEAWLRLQARPDVRTRGTARFAGFTQGAEAARRLAQSGLYPSDCRLLDPLEAELNGAGEGAVLLVGFEAAGGRQELVDQMLAEALDICRDAGATNVEASSAAAAGWRASFLRAPYLRDALALLGLVVETFETACTWDRLAELHESVISAAREAAGAGWITCRLTHVYPDGPAPYFTVVCPGRAGSEIAQWDAIKAACSDALAAAGGTITHHHAVGRDHRRWYVEEVPAPFLAALRQARLELDPAGIMNPGVLGL